MSFNEDVLVALLTGALLERDASINRTVAADAARQVIASRHYAIISPSRDTIGHLATLHSSTASDEAKAAAHAAIARTGHRSSAEGLVHPTDLGTDIHAHRAFNNSYNQFMNGKLAGGLSAAGHHYVRAIGGYKEAGVDANGIPTEGSFVIPGVHAGAKLRQESAVHFGHAFAQDSIIYSGPETQHEPRMFDLHYNADGSPDKGKFHHSMAFDPTRVRAVTPGGANRAASLGRMVAFTHAFDPTADPMRHAIPRQEINQVAFRLLGRNAGPSPADVKN